MVVKRISAAVEKEFQEYKAREARLEKNLMSKQPGELGHVPYRGMDAVKESYQVRSHASALPEGRFDTLSKAEALEVGRKVSMLPPDHAASVFKYHHKEFREPDAIETYLHGRDGFAERSR